MGDQQMARSCGSRHLRSADLQRRGELTAALDDCEIDSIVHAAAVTATTEEVERDSTSTIVEVNVGGTTEALDAASAHCCRRFM